MDKVDNFVVRCGVCCERSRLKLGASRKALQSDLRRDVRIATRGLSVINYFMPAYLIK